MNWQTSRHRGSTRQQRRIRTAVLTRDPICRCPGCPACSGDCRRSSTEDDHIIPLAAGGSDHDLTNRQGLCAPCHTSKTQREAAAGRRRPHRTDEPHPGLITRPGG